MTPKLLRTLSLKAIRMNPDSQYPVQAKAYCPYGLVTNSGITKAMIIAEGAAIRTYKSSLSENLYRSSSLPLLLKFHCPSRYAQLVGAVEAIPNAIPNTMLVIACAFMAPAWISLEVSCLPHQSLRLARQQLPSGLVMVLTEWIMMGAMITITFISPNPRQQQRCTSLLSSPMYSLQSHSWNLSRYSVHIIAPIVSPIRISLPVCAPRYILDTGTRIAATKGSRYPKLQQPAPRKSVIKGSQISKAIQECPEGLPNCVGQVHYNSLTSLDAQKGRGSWQDDLSMFIMYVLRRKLVMKTTEASFLLQKTYIRARRPSRKQVLRSIDSRFMNTVSDGLLTF